MSLNAIEKEIDFRSKFERHQVRDPYKSFFNKSVSSDEIPTPVMQGLIPKTEFAIERSSTPELHNPGEYCYREMALATGRGDNPKTIFVKRVMMNCPFCNKPQFLYKNEQVYDGKPDPRMFWQKWINKRWPKLFSWTQQLTGTLTVKGPITCIFNDMHRWTVVKNKISFYYPKTLTK